MRPAVRDVSLTAHQQRTSRRGGIRLPRRDGAPRVPAGRRPPHHRRVPWALMAPAVVIAFLFNYVGVGAGGWYAVTDWNGIGGAAHFVGLENFRAIFHDSVARGALLHTVELAALFVIASNAIGLGLAVGLNRGVKSRHVLRTVFFASAVMSPLAVSYIWKYIFDYRGPLNAVLKAAGLGSWQQTWTGSPTWAIWTVFVVMVWQFSGLTMVMYLAGLQTIPEEIDEAALVDGASATSRFRWVTLPLLAPSLTIAITYTLILGFRVFDQIVALTGGGPGNATESLSTQVWEETFAYGRFGYGSALAVLMTVLIVAVTLIELVGLRRRENRMA